MASAADWTRRQEQAALRPPVQFLAKRDHVFTLAGQQVIEHPVAPVEHLGPAFRGVVEGAGDRIVGVGRRTRSSCRPEEIASSSFGTPGRSNSGLVK